MKPYFEQENFKLFKGDCIEILRKLTKNSVSLIFADPPYFLSNDGITCKAGRMVSVNKGKWDKSQGHEKDYDFTLSWLKSCKKVLKNEGSIWISGTLHNIYKNGFALEKLAFDILNEIIWFKPNAPPNLSCKYFTHSHETLIWAKKNNGHKHIFNYNEMKNWENSSDKLHQKGKQMRTIWCIPVTPKSEKISGGHPTQKPLELLKRIITACSDENDTIIDPFNGSGTTGIASYLLKRKYIGIDNDKKFLEMTKKRFKEIVQ